VRGGNGRGGVQATGTPDENAWPTMQTQVPFPNMVDLQKHRIASLVGSGETREREPIGIPRDTMRAEA
jgi:hypothetical protein